MATVEAHKEARTEFARVVGKRIFRARKALGMTHRQVADKLGLSASETVGYWESGRNYPPSYLLVRLADLLEVGLDDLIRL